MSDTTANPLTPFHLAIAVHSLSAARHFYGELLGCSEGRSAEQWVDFNLYGHQLVCHRLAASADATPTQGANPVDGHDVPVPHFGVVLQPDQWHHLAARLTSAGVNFVIEPQTRFAGTAGEQSTLFLLDPSGNALEFKAFADINAQLFASD
ncbi:MAG: VOC family protein [Pseudomonadales bacterium]